MGLQFRLRGYFICMMLLLMGATAPLAQAVSDVLTIDSPFELLSLNGDPAVIGLGGDSTSANPSVSSNGRFVAFASNASNLVASDPNGNGADIFVYDRDSDTTELLTAGSNNTSFAPSISGDGRFVAFYSQASNLVASDPNGTTPDIFVYDRESDTIELLTSGGNNTSFAPSISADGRYVAFYSNASNLVANDPNGVNADIFVYDRDSGTTELLTSGSDGANLNPSISADGRFVAFYSRASNLVPTDPNGITPDIFVYDRDSGTTELLTTSGDGTSTNPSISADGRLVAFSSRATNLVTSDPNGSENDIFVYDRDSDTTELLTSGGNSSSAFPSISADGRFVAFFSNASNLVTNDANGTGGDIFVFDLASDTTELLTPGGNSSSGSPSISADGRFVTFASNASNLVLDDPNGTIGDIFVFNRDSGATELVTSDNNGASVNPSISADGRFVAFYSYAPNLVASDPNGTTPDIFVYDRESDTIELLTSGGNNTSFAPSISADGRYVAFYSNASNLVANDPNGVNADIFVYDRDSGTTELLTSGSDGANLNPSISADGRFVAFYSRASNLVPTDPNGITPDIFVYDRDSGTTELLTTSGDGTSTNPSISADGRLVAFSSRATNLVTSDPNGSENDIFVYDRDSDTTELLTSGGNSSSAFPSISADGRFVAFFSNASNLVTNDANGTGGDIFVFDLASDTTELLTPGGNSSSGSPSISADGRLVAFTSRASNLVLTDPNGTEADIFVYDRALGITELLTAGGNNSSVNPSISGDGQTVTFQTSASNLFPTGNTNQNILAIPFTAQNAPPAADATVTLFSAVLPASRSVEVGATATAFATLINAGTATAEGCGLQLPDTLAAGFFYQSSDQETNAVVGQPNQPVDIPAGGSQSFVFGITPNEALSATEVALRFQCANATDAASFVGLNTLLLSASATPVPDLIALAATTTRNGVMELTNNNGFFTAATINVGSASTITVSTDTGGTALPIILSLCQTNPATSACINPVVPNTEPVMVEIAEGDTPTFAVFASGDESIPLDPANSRVFIRFSDDSGEVRGATSVAVQNTP